MAVLHRHKHACRFGGNWCCEPRPVSVPDQISLNFAERGVMRIPSLAKIEHKLQVASGRRKGSIHKGFLGSESLIDSIYSCAKYRSQCSLHPNPYSLGARKSSIEPSGFYASPLPSCCCCGFSASSASGKLSRPCVMQTFACLVYPCCYFRRG